MHTWLNIASKVWDENTKCFMHGPMVDPPGDLRVGLEPLESLPALLPMDSDGIFTG